MAAPARNGPKGITDFRPALARMAYAIPTTLPRMEDTKITNGTDCSGMLQARIRRFGPLGRIAADCLRTRHARAQRGRCARRGDEQYGRSRSGAFVHRAGWMQAQDPARIPRLARSAGHSRA